MFGLVVVGVTALMTFAASASAAPVLTSPAGTEYTGEIHATLESGTEAVLKAGIEDKCSESTAKGTVATNNESHAAGTLSVLSFAKCTQDTSVIATGSLTINSLGEVFAIGNRVEVKVTALGITCFYGGGESPGTKLGSLTTGSPAKLAISAAKLKRLEGSNTTFCAKEGSWTASYVVTTPASLFIDLQSPPQPGFTSPAGTEYTGEIHASLEAGTWLLIKAGYENHCSESTVSGTVKANNTEHLEATLSKWTFGACTVDTTVTTPGKLTVDDNGTVFIEGSRMEEKTTGLGTTCFYGAESGPVDIGKLTPGTPATIDVSTTELKRLVGSNNFCPSTLAWEGRFLITTPSSLLLT